MEELGSIDPGLFVEPIIFNKIKAFENATSSGTLVSNALVIVIVLTTILLAAIITISERSENAQLRLDLSQTPKIIRILGKLFGYVIVGFAEATLIVFVSGLKITLPFEILGLTQLGYGVPMTIFTLFNIYFAVALISVTFAAIGIAVASFSKSQSTAILASLLLVVPMLFLSGIVLPLEFMDPIMRTLSMLLPLTAANTLLTDVIARDLVAFNDIIPITVLLTISIVSIVLVNFKKSLYK
jgi:ABC-type multidrug transport system permease subunit